jgi:hypothetical protein
VHLQIEKIIGENIMKKTRWNLVLLFISAIVLWGCKSSTTDSGAADTGAAYTVMENQFFAAANNGIDKVDFTEANTLYRSAVAASPNNAEANLGAGITEVFLIYTDPDVRSALTGLQNSVTPVSLLGKFGIPSGTKDINVPYTALASNLFNIIQTAQGDPVTISRVQEILKTKVLPRINYALERLAVAEQHPEFEMKISGKMQGNEKLSAVYLDLTEVYFMDAMLNGMKALVSEFLIFRFDLPSYTTSAVVQALNRDNTTFFVLASDGASYSAGVKSSLLAAFGKFRAGINFLKNETDDQNDDIIKKSSSGEMDNALADVDKMEQYLTTPMTLDVNNWTSDGKNYTIQINLGAFFDNPPSNPKKDWLPEYTVDSTMHGDIVWQWTQQSYASFTFPDPTFNGVFPGMTNDLLKQLLRLEETFAWKVSLYINDNNGMLNSAGATVSVGGKEYEMTEESYYPNTYGKSFKVSVLDAESGSPAVITVNLNGIPSQLELYPSLTAHPKSYTDVSANVTAAPQDLGASLLNNPAGVQLNFSYGTYRIFREANGGGFTLYDSVSYNSQFTDGNVIHGSTYRYRILPSMVWQSYFEYYGNYVIGWRADNYSNTVSIAVP